ELVDAFLAAARNGDFHALVAVLDPHVVLRADGGDTGLSREVHGAETVAGQAMMWSGVGLSLRRALVNGAAGIVSTRNGQPFSLAAITGREDRRDRHLGGPRAPSPPGPERARRLTRRPRAALGALDREDDPLVANA